VRSAATKTLRDKIDAALARSPERPAWRFQARVGHLDLRAQAEVPSALRADTPKAIRLLAFRASG
jgi:hypothetical protein